MQWIVGMTFPVAAVLFVLTAARNIVAKKARCIRKRMEQRYGSGIRLMAGCGVVNETGRVPGVLVLADNLLAYECVLAKGRGEIDFSSVKEYDFEDSARTRHVQARKYLQARVLALYTDGAHPRLFVIPALRAKEWDIGLRRALGEPRKA
ncbi:MAG: hypothetical protein GF344_15560 [Chitinivibrionales bacterium]|nr:hypothetical protein [Chitinivibrionales bacterium]MBD3358117.1 hypothetical protein [Chitinivibrionales bacterium]